MCIVGDEICTDGFVFLSDEDLCCDTICLSFLACGLEDDFVGSYFRIDMFDGFGLQSISLTITEVSFVVDDICIGCDDECDRCSPYRRSRRCVDDRA